MVKSGDAAREPRPPRDPVAERSVMRKIAVTTDMAADMPEGFFAANGVTVLPMPFTLGGHDYFDGPLPSPAEFYGALRAGAIASTSQTSAYAAIHAFEGLLKEGFDILHISFSSGMSGSAANISAAAKELLVKYRDASIRVVDSLSGCGGQGLMVKAALQMRDEGMKLDEIADKLEADRMNYHHFVIVEDLNSLYRGGRLSRLEAAVGTVLGIKPLLELNHYGKIMPLLKVMGKKKALAAITEQVVKFYRPEKDGFILVEHGDDLAGAEALAARIKAALPDADIRYATVNYLVGAHAGPGALAVFFHGAERPRFINVPIPGLKTAK